MSAPNSAGSAGGGGYVSPGYGSDGETRKVSESAFEYLFAEILAMELPEEGIRGGGSSSSSSSSRGICSVGSNSSSNGDSNAVITQRLDNLGYDVGFRFVEKVVANQKYIGSEALDIVKFICKDFWEEVFGKKVIHNYYTLRMKLFFLYNELTISSRL